MKHFIFCILIFSTVSASAQSPKIELYNLIKQLLTDSSGYENVGDWSVGKPKKFSVKWQEDRIVMSEDTSINFFRKGSANIAINGKTFMQAGKAVNWYVMLKGPRMGYTSFSIVSSPLCSEMQAGYTIDSLFGKKPFIAKLLKSCDGKKLSGFYYYEVKLPKKDKAFIKFSWVSVNNNAALRIDCYDTYSQYAAKLNCN
jgi:hypothetical protein